MQPEMSQMQGGQTQQPTQQFDQMGQQRNQQMGQQRSQQMGQRYQDVETPQQQAAIDEIGWAVRVCEWCADQCIQHADPNMVECIRLCEDVSELGETALTLIPRNSRHVQQHLQTLQQALEACAQECGQHQHAHCQECAQILPEVMQSIQQYTGSFQQMGGQQMGGQQMSGQQMGGFQ